MKNDRVVGSRRVFSQVVGSLIPEWQIPTDMQVLIVGGSTDDEDVLRLAGFTRIVNSNLSGSIDRMLSGDSDNPGRYVPLDAEQMEMPDSSFDLVFAHAVLHHCRSPHRALCEMLRVSRRYIMFMEPNDSLIMSLLVKLRFSFPYELPAVVDHDYRTGGVRDSHIPNFIYRWNRSDILKTVSSYMPEFNLLVRTFPYWDFSVSERELALRTETRIGGITSKLGAGRFLSILQLARAVLNRASIFRRQGNRLFCCVEKGKGLKPWLVREGPDIAFNRAYVRHKP